MSDVTNPYQPNEPVSHPEMLFGRQEAVDWVELQISNGNRVLVLSALPLIGKTSFLKQIDRLKTNQAVGLSVWLSNIPSLAIASGHQDKKNKKASTKQISEPTIDTVLQAVVEQLIPQLRSNGLISLEDRPPIETTQMTSTLRQLFGQAKQQLQPVQPLTLYVDDLHLLINQDLALIASFLTSLTPLLDECPNLHLIFAANQNGLRRIHHPLIDGAPTFNFGYLALDASINMITLPVQDILRFDYGIVKRIAEINSHHPYYISLFCHTLLNRQVYDGWVNQRDFDATLAEILDQPIEPFKQIWDKSSWPERAVLVGLSAIQGAHGPITNQEIIRFLQRQSPAVAPKVVSQALLTLAKRGVLIPMGAVSYRFHVDLLRYWLRAHTSVSEILNQVNWSQAAAQLKASEVAISPHPILPNMSAGNGPPTSQKRRWPLVLAAILALLLCVGVGSTLALSQMLELPFLAFIMPPTPTPTPTATPKDIVPIKGATETPVATPEPAEPTPTATPTAPLVVARTLPSITYMGRDVDQPWHIYVMNADGSDTTLLSPEGGDDTGPVWSPDGQKIAFVSRRDENREVYVIDVTGQNMINVTRHPADDWTPAWSNDGSQLAFASFRTGGWEIFVMDTACFSEPSTCPNSLTQVTADGNGNLSPVWSPDGTRFAFSGKAKGDWDIYTMTTDGTDIRQITTSPENDLAPTWSPDGTRIAFETNRDGNVEIYVVATNGGVPENITDLPLANEHGPTWSPDGQQIVFYSNREGNWDIFSTSLNNQTVINLTNTPTRDEQTPAWRP